MADATNPNADVPDEVFRAASQVVGAQINPQGRPSDSMLELRPGARESAPVLKAEAMLPLLADIHDTGNRPLLDEGDKAP